MFLITFIFLIQSWASLSFGQQQPQEQFATEGAIAAPVHMAELEVSRGILDLNAGKLEDAQRRFSNALRWSPHYPLALEYLAVVAERRRQFRPAIEWLKEARNYAPSRRKGMLDFHLGRLHLEVGLPGAAEGYFRSAIREKVFLAHSHYFIALALHQQEKFIDAHQGFLEALKWCRMKEALAAEQALEQSIQYYLAEIHARTGWEKYALSGTRAVEKGESGELRQWAWALNKDLNRSRFYATFQETVQRDSRLTLVPLHHIVPTHVLMDRAVRSQFFINGGWRSASAQKFTFGAEAHFHYSKDVSNTFRELDSLRYGAKLWIKAWTQTTWDLTGSYEPTRMMIDSRSYQDYEVTHPFTLALNYFPYLNWNWTAGLQYFYNVMLDENLDGQTLGFFLRTEMRNPSSKFLPRLGYRFFHDRPRIIEFDTWNHVVDLLIDLRVAEKTRVLPRFSFGMSDYFRSLNERKENFYQLGTEVSHSINEHWLFFLDSNFTWRRSAPEATGFDYRKHQLSGGVRVQI